jgi:predicted metalloprotease with PDZ domain
VGDDFAFFTGIQLFMEPLGHRNDPSTVKFQIPQGWKLMSPLKSTSDPMTFIAADYDILVDAPAMMGNFDIHEFSVDGKPHYFTAYPAGRFNSEKSKRFTEMLGASIKAQAAIFGGLPYEKYIALYFFQPAESNASGALEHLNSFVAFAPGGERSTPEQIIGTASHEFFHLWNVKRIRPAEMWPYDYSRENETPLLWVSEGFTNYYGNVLEYRAGLDSEETFLRSAANAAAGVENNEVRNYVSPAEASVSTWVGYDTPVAFGISYYGQGQNLAALLDLSIRNDTDGRHSLDDVMRALFNDYYKKGRGFTIADMLSEIRKLTKKDYDEFYRRYVFGTDVPNYDEIFGFAGYRVQKAEEKTPDFGFFGRFRNNGYMLTSVVPNSPAAAAGLNSGDVITKIDGKPVAGSLLSAAAGKTLTLTVRHGDTENDVKLDVGTRRFTGYSLVDLAERSPKQTRIREGWLKR